MSNLQPNCCLKFDFQKVDQHAGGKYQQSDCGKKMVKRLFYLLNGICYICKI